VIFATGTECSANISALRWETLAWVMPGYRLFSKDFHGPVIIRQFGFMKLEIANIGKAPVDGQGRTMFGTSD
jgi:hypothetical protein